METSAAQKQQTGPEKTATLTDSTGTIAFDTSSGISLDEQQEILEVINTITGGSRLSSEASVITAKKKGYLFPMFVNIAAVVILAAGFYLLSRIHVQEAEEIRSNSASLGLTERKLIQEIREGTSPAAEELMRLSDERDRAARIGSLVGGFFTRARVQIEEGHLNEASATLAEARQFLNAPSLRGVHSLEAGRQSYLTAIDSLERAVFEAMRLKEAAAGGSAVAPNEALLNEALSNEALLNEALAKQSARIAALQEESASLSVQGSNRASLITEQESRITGQQTRITEQESRITEQELRIRQLENANTNQQETLNRRDAELVTLRNEREERERRISSLNASLAEQVSQKEELQRQYNNLQARLDAAMRLFQTE